MKDSMASHLVKEAWPARNTTVFTTSSSRITNMDKFLQKVKLLSQLTLFKHLKENRSVWPNLSLLLLVSLKPNHLQRKTKPKLTHLFMHHSLVQRGPLKSPKASMSLPLSILDFLKTQSKGLTLVDSWRTHLKTLSSIERPREHLDNMTKLDLNSLKTTTTLCIHWLLQLTIPLMERSSDRCREHSVSMFNLKIETF